MADLYVTYFGRAVGINVDYRILEDAVNPVNASAEIYAGRPVVLDASGYVSPVTSDVPVYGLAKANKNSYIDETRGAYGAYGSGQMAVVVLGIVTVRHNVFYGSDGSENKVETYVTGLNYNYMDKLYVDTETGKITNDDTASNTFIGYCLSSISSSATDDAMRILLVK
jgi:hypothetical protein